MIRREIEVTRKGLPRPIDVTYGTNLIPIEFVVTDFNIPEGSTVVAYNSGKSGEVNKQICEINGNVISFTPEAAFFEKGRNELQYRVVHDDRSLFTFKCRVECQGSFVDSDAEEVKRNSSLVEQLMTEQAVTKARLEEVLKLPDDGTDVEKTVNDIKVGADGKVYPSPGEAVRQQIGQVSSRVDDLNAEVFPPGQYEEVVRDLYESEYTEEEDFFSIFAPENDAIRITFHNTTESWKYKAILVASGEKYRISTTVMYKDNLYYPLIALLSEIPSSYSGDFYDFIEDTDGNYNYWGAEKNNVTYDLTIPNGCKMLLVNDITGVATVKKIEKKGISTELFDGRIDFSGKTWKNIGEHIRCVTGTLSERIVDITNTTGILSEHVGNLEEEIENLKNGTSGSTGSGEQYEYEEVPRDLYESEYTEEEDFFSIFAPENDAIRITFHNITESWKYKAIPVASGEKYRISTTVMYQDNLYYPLIALLSEIPSSYSGDFYDFIEDSDGNYNYWGAEKNNVTYDLTIPNGCKMLLVNNINGVATVKKIEKKLIVDEEGQTPSEEDQTPIVELYIPEFKIYTGENRENQRPLYKENDDGQWAVTTFIPVSKGDEIYYSGSIYKNPAVALYDKFGQYVSNLAPHLELYTVYEDERVENATVDGFITAYSYKINGGKKTTLSVKIVGNRERNEVQADYRMNYIYVAVDGSDETGDGTINNPFASIYHANNLIKANMPNNRYTIIVKKGEYTDLQERYSGVGDSGTYQGVKTKPYVYYESEQPERPDLCVIKWNGATGLTTPCTIEDVNDKCPFHIVGELLPFPMDTHVKGFTFDCVNTRYAFHVEMAGATYGNKWKIENCIFKFSGRPDVTEDNQKTAPAVGMGSGFSEIGVFKDCVFDNLQNGYQSALNVHDNVFNREGVALYMYKGFEYLIDGCLFKNCNTIGLSSIHNDVNTYDVDNVLYIKHSSGLETVNTNEHMKYKILDK